MGKKLQKISIGTKQMENLSKTVKRTLFSGSLASSPMPEVMML
jgi:hypothetical protein